MCGAFNRVVSLRISPLPLPTKVVQVPSPVAQKKFARVEYSVARDFEALSQLPNLLHPP